MRTAGEQTRQRILKAATAEFSRHGFAGARVNRIATRARASKERLYAYFPSKQDLWNAVSRQIHLDMTAEADLHGQDLPGYAGRLFDLYVRSPEVTHFQNWARLERRDEPRGKSDEVQALMGKVQEIVDAQARGEVDPSWDPVELIVILPGIARAMADPPPAARALARESGYLDSIDARRHAVIKAARHLINNPKP